MGGGSGPQRRKSLGAPVGAASERGVAFKLDRDKARSHVVAAAGEQVRVCIWIGLCQGGGAAGRDARLGYGGESVSRDWAQLREGADEPSMSIARPEARAQRAPLASMKDLTTFGYS